VSVYFLWCMCWSQKRVTELAVWCSTCRITEDIWSVVLVWGCILLKGRVTVAHVLLVLHCCQAEVWRHGLCMGGRGMFEVKILTCLASQCRNYCVRFVED